MASKLTGKKIRKVRICKSKVVITFTDKTKMDISYDTYTSFYLFDGKELSYDELKDIKEVNSISALLNTALGIVKKAVTTEKRLKEKLYAKGGDKRKIESVIKTLKENNLIDDKAYIQDFLIYAAEKKMGQFKITEELRKRGIEEKDLKSLHFKETKELEKAKSLLSSLERRYSKYNYLEKKQHIYSNLVSHGFTSEIASSVSSLIKADSKQESNVLAKDFAKAYTRLSSKYDGRELYDKVIKSLLQKGYKYQEIKKKIEEKVNETN